MKSVKEIKAILDEIARQVDLPEKKVAPFYFSYWIVCVDYGPVEERGQW